MENRYLLLHTIAILFEVVGRLILILGVLAVLLLAGSSGTLKLGALEERVPLYWKQLGLPNVSTPVAMGMTALASLLSFLVLCAAGQLIFLLLDIDQNTRQMAQYLKPAV